MITPTLAVSAGLAPPQTLLRDLSDDEFASRYDCDRFTAGVVANRLRYSVQHVTTGLLHRAFSPIIALCYDFAACICAPPEQDYAMSAVTNGLSVFLGTMSDAVRVTVEEYGPERLVPGDLLVCNDVYRVGNHYNDVLFVRPVFYDEKIVGFLALRAHQLDAGGIFPGGFSAMKHNIYEDGIVISPRLLYHAGEPVRETFSLIFDNVRLGELMLPDFKTIHGCCTLGERLIRETIDRYGIQAYLGSMRYACDASAERMRGAFASLPDGDYSGSGRLDADGVDDAEEYVVRLNLRKRGSAVEVDFSGSSRQARTCINAGALDVKTAVGVGLKMVLSPDSEFTSGTFRDFDILVPPGSITSALPPDGAVFCYYEVQSLIVTILLRVLGPVLGADALGGDFGAAYVHNANGVGPDGTPWFCSAMAGGEHGPRGGSKEGDGDGCSCAYIFNLMSPSTESLEADFPLRIMRREFVADTAGPGVARGGAAIVKDIQYTQAGQHQTVPLRFREASGVGVYGGRDGALGGVWIFGQDGAPVTGPESLIGFGPAVYAGSVAVAGTLDPASQVPDPDGEFFYYGRTPIWSTATGATWRYLTNGGGGWGDPFARDPELVKRDVRDEYITVEGAARDFGVVVVGDAYADPEGLRVDLAATESLRAAEA
ncbi:methylhydantoinase [Nocardia neocaledoniensis NBRC 108232]|uniref:N-methylhydantoinase B n=1 Tax=Nocardia neocaledoniensis TaxID=236511 RepID=A0A317N2T2_9NOCA|nr:hydantoinase B/oxoprolinase family protein [Nocardia neocaledoniensis]PWV67557.1 N-methylhydantoinase B [Nocardia neocaledoniensis]GEM31255.1 methylhydantoinase [Nocardia neocaledoniensis NBRC 108232]